MAADPYSLDPNEQRKKMLMDALGNPVGTAPLDPGAAFAGSGNNGTPTVTGVPTPAPAAPTATPAAPTNPNQWIDDALKKANSTDDPNYWYKAAGNDPNAAGSANAWWQDAIARGDGAEAVRNGTLQKRDASTNDRGLASSGGNPVSAAQSGIGSASSSISSTLSGDPTSAIQAALAKMQGGGDSTLIQKLIAQLQGGQ